MKERTSRARPPARQTRASIPKDIEIERDPVTPDPTEAEIAERCAEIRKDWSLNCHISRWVGKLGDLPAVLLDQGFDADVVAEAIEQHQCELFRRERRRAW
jgi:hypothetical protein